MQRGFTIIEVIIVATVLALASLGGYIILSQKTDSSTPQTTSIEPTTTPSASPTETPQPTTTNKYADGNLPLGDGKVTTSGPQKGYVYSCTSAFRGGGAQHTGDWIEGSIWEPGKKLHVQGDVPWPSAKVSIAIQGDKRVISGNGLPTTHTTGIFPIQITDPAYQIDHNPNPISAQSISISLPANPSIAGSPSCLGGGAIGYMTNGVALFDALDAAGRDAAAHEVQDHCDGHPEKNGEYHYHSLSSCYKHVADTTVIGFAIDGFPITGNIQASGHILTTDDLDDCHGTTSSIQVDGRQISMYHYVMTADYPYSLGCFKGTPLRHNPSP